MLVGATHPYLDPLDNSTILGQEFEFSWVIEERELFAADARTVHAFKSPLFRLPDPDPLVSHETGTSPSRLQLQIEVPPFLTEADIIPCRVLLVSPDGDVIETTINGHHYILRNKHDSREHILFMIRADIQQKTSRRSKFYAYEFHLRISREEMEWNALSGMGGVGTKGTAMLMQCTPNATVTSNGLPVSSLTSGGISVFGAGVGSGGAIAGTMATTGSTAGAASGGEIPVSKTSVACGENIGSSSGSPASLRLPSTMLENDEITLTFRGSEDRMIMTKKSVLASQSERFREMMNEMTRGIKLRLPAQFSFDVMLEVVRFLQSGVCEKWEQLVEGIADAAVFFKIDQLQRLADHKRDLIHF